MFGELVVITIGVVAIIGIITEGIVKYNKNENEMWKARMENEHRKVKSKPQTEQIEKE